MAWHECSYLSSWHMHATVVVMIRRQRHHADLHRGRYTPHLQLHSVVVMLVFARQARSMGVKH